MDRFFVNVKTACNAWFRKRFSVEEGTVVIVFNPAIFNDFLFLNQVNL